MARDPGVTSRIMSAVRHTGTRPEMALRRELHKRGLRYRVSTNLMGKPDIVFGPARIACFVDGDRWHGNGWRTRGFKSFEDEFKHANSDFWKQKISRNMQRDAEVTEALTADGWKVIRIWASDVERDLVAAADRIEFAVRASHGGTGR
ncbi:very short patch repair endonuclease [Nocardia sp. NPDC050193]